METRTYYDILGVSREATLEEITSAKNALAKVYHPDANMHNDIDTTGYMQEILEAYRTLANPDRRSKYNRKLVGKPNRVFRTYTVGKPEEESADSSASFVTYWNAACRLNEIVSQSGSLMELHSKKEALPLKIFKRLGKKDKYEIELTEQLSSLSMQAIQYISILRSAEIPMSYWQSDAMNWVLVRWGQKQHMDYHILFDKYDAYVEQNRTSTEKLKLRSQYKQFQNTLKKLLSYAVA
ncbi:J domain-containing protein [Eubacterium sp. am_0171]|uniref:Chaperone protein DnaJ n=1 Tax=Faecalicatena contorta TaxID=39482 RepID=A0A174M6D6_9FIRM|nr:MULTISPECIES: J domain-containing protein [Clostridia]MDU7708943.1 J domain-containing protein [Clostridium sp.]MSC85667.1 DnaJ domain-containing protein [Eubacterium sp. BIOML-A1]MSD08081.1 DnaJ domain-containing protein [Eubacterium sp. BIOML-A2]RYT13136.1 J domain-containing protein [Eubacterium sp. am_0171]CUP31994.1 Chaperone protein DnaJ [[Eubacterium] contortum] [Faecalicatena contorta]